LLKRDPILHWVKGPGEFDYVDARCPLRLIVPHMQEA